MRRAGVSALLIVCLVTFLCPGVGKANMITVTKAPDCCSKMSGCKMTPEQKSHHDRCGHESQHSSCCTVSCSTLILFCPASERLSTPGFGSHTFPIEDAAASPRIERPPTPPPRIRIYLKTFGSAQNLTHSACVFMQPRIHEISTGENHEISTFDCSNDGTDERDDDLVQ
jgi:hypothetical protein